ncbi:MAG: hypothetical protein ABSF43_02045 [Rectinemataceae bacterium]|jgi:hypothetical protein
MKGHTEKAKDHVKNNTKAKSAKADTKVEGLDPCAKPQAQEASSFRSTDEACDDGVK